MKRSAVWALASLVMGCLAPLLVQPVTAADNTIKVAVVMPEGSTWTTILHQMTAEANRLSGGELNFTTYAGGISGDEADVIRKMRANRIQAAGFSGIGLGVILPQVRILESVLLFADANEIDQVKDRLFEDFASKFEEKGFVLLGFFEAGFTYIFSKKPITGLDEVKNLKMWVWKGDQIAERYLAELGIATFPLNMTDVNTGLETGMIDAFYSPPLAAIALQWYARVTHMLDYPLVDSNGAFLMNRRDFQQLSEKNQKILKTAVKKYCRQLVEQTRKENSEARELIQQAGIQFIPPTAKQRDFFMAAAQKAQKANQGELYDKQLYERVEGLLREIRANPTQQNQKSQ
jgi:TRAP-type C4-dicarboxylate transport system substrate-binding protein